MLADLWLTRSRSFYGWVIVAGMAVVGFVITLMLGANVGVFIEPMREDLGIGVAPFGFAQTARLVSFAGSGFVLGRLLDRYGARIPMAAGAVLFGLAVSALGLVNAGWQIVVLFSLVGAIGFQSGQALYTTVPIAQWFVKRRGRAMALAFSGVPLGIGVSGPLTQLLINQFGWRGAWFMLGGGGSVVIILVSLLLVRRRPEDMGLVPDGPVAAASGPDAAAQPAGAAPEAGESSWTRAEAVRTPAFWMLAVSFGLFMFGTGTLSVFRIPYFVEQGISSNVAAWSLPADSVASTALALSAGFFLDRSSLRTVAAIGFGLLILSFALTMITTSAWQMVVAMTAFGFGISTGMVVQNAIWPAYFGRANLGAIRAAAMPITLAIAAGGAPAAGLAQDYLGGFSRAWYASMLLVAIAAVLVLMARPPKRPYDRDPVLDQHRVG